MAKMQILTENSENRTEIGKLTKVIFGVLCAALTYDVMHN